MLRQQQSDKHFGGQKRGNVSPFHKDTLPYFCQVINGISTIRQNFVHAGRNVACYGRAWERAEVMRKTILDDGFQSYLTEGAVLVGEPGIPMLMDMQNVQIPKGIIPFSKARSCKDKRQFVHFYEHDREFSRVMTATTKYLPLLQEYDGIITPDCTMMINQAPCLQQTNTYFNRAIGYYCQRNGIPVIVNIRWSDESSFPYCFLGAPKGSIVAVSTHGCLRSREQKSMFNRGMHAMLDAIEPKAVLVHGYMPDDVFGEFHGQVDMYRYPSLFELTHLKKGGA